MCRARVLDSVERSVSFVRTLHVREGVTSADADTTRVHARQKHDAARLAIHRDGNTNAVGQPEHRTLAIVQRVDAHSRRLFRIVHVPHHELLTRRRGKVPRGGKGKHASRETLPWPIESLGIPPCTRFDEPVTSPRRRLRRLRSVVVFRRMMRDGTTIPLLLAVNHVLNVRKRRSGLVPLRAWRMPRLVVRRDAQGHDVEFQLVLVRLLVRHVSK
mmetsp:Transcript_2026/g.5421  ORF Transcript_2026/g.5421 Transcript_2026/m.5421 type:complete len:215 (+) Transcript_2026:28-672(+)